MAQVSYYAECQARGRGSKGVVLAICQQITSPQRLTPSVHGVSSGLTHGGQRRSQSQEDRSEHTLKEHITASWLHGTNIRLRIQYASPTLQAARSTMLGSIENKLHGKMLKPRVLGARSFRLRSFILWHIYLNGISLINAVFRLMKKINTKKTNGLFCPYL